MTGIFDQQNQVNSTSTILNKQFNSINTITIKGDTDFINKASIYGWIGNGTKENPFIIENLIINTNTSSAIYISGTSVYFIIRNCTVTETADVSTSAYTIYAGIALSNVKNGLIINNTSASNMVQGIEIDQSNNINLTNNVIYGNKGDAIVFQQSNKIIVKDNVVKTSNVGIYIGSNSNQNIIIDNFVDSNIGAGIIIVDKSNNNLISGNIVQNSIDGITVVTASSNLISNNTLQDNNFGVDLQSPYGSSGTKIMSSTTYNLVTFNNFYNNTDQAYCDDKSNQFKGNYWSNHLSGKPYNVDGNVISDTNPVIKPNEVNITEDQIPMLLQQISILNSIASLGRSFTSSTISTKQSMTTQSNQDNKTLFTSSNVGLLSNLPVLMFSIVLITVIISSTFIYYERSKSDSKDKPELRYQNNIGIKSTKNELSLLANNSNDNRCKNCCWVFQKEDIFCYNCGKRLK